MEPTTRGVTAEDLFRQPDDGWRYELIDGQVIRMTPSGFRHGVVVAVLTQRLRAYVADHKMGVVCAPRLALSCRDRQNTVRAPDVAFVTRERIARFGIPAKFWSGPPDLAVEVTSPTDSAAGVDAKARQWLSAGARGLGGASRGANARRVASRPRVTSASGRRSPGR